MQPSYSDVSQPNCKFHVTTYERRFGSWRSALEAFVNYTDKFSNEESEVKFIPKDKKKRTPRNPDLRLRFKVLKKIILLAVSAEDLQLLHLE